MEEFSIYSKFINKQQILDSKFNSVENEVTLYFLEKYVWAISYQLRNWMIYADPGNIVKINQKIPFSRSEWDTKF